jgi:hypothetical protein
MLRLIQPTYLSYTTLFFIDVDAFYITILFLRERNIQKSQLTRLLCMIFRSIFYVSSLFADYG